MTQIPLRFLRSISRKSPRNSLSGVAEAGRLAGKARQIKQSCAFGAALAGVLLAAPGQGPAQTAARTAVPAPARIPPENTDFDVVYGAYFLGLKLMETEIQASFTPSAYDVRSTWRTDGLVWWVKKDKIESVASGATDGQRLAPEYYLHRDMLQRGRTVTLNFTPDDIQVTAEPPYSTLGDPPATQQHRRGAYDIISGIMQASMNIGDDDAYPCGPDIPVFDGQQRYDLRMAHQGEREGETDAYTGNVIVCDVYYMPVAGFDADDVPEDKFLNTPLTVWYTDDPAHGFHIPVRFTYPVGLGTLVIEAKTLAVQSGAAE